MEIYCVDFRLEWPVRTLSFSHDGKMLASASEDLIIDIAEVDSGTNVVVAVICMVCLCWVMQPAWKM